MAIDNILSERLIRGIAVSRKNWGPIKAGSAPLSSTR